MGWKPLMVSHYLAMFSGCWSSSNEEITNLNFCVTSQDGVIEGSSDFIGGAPYSVSTLTQIRLPQTLQNWRYVFNLSRDLGRPRGKKIIYEQELLQLSHYSAKFGGHRHCGIGDMFLLVEEQDSTCLILSLLFSSKAHGMSCSHIQNSQ